MEEERKDVQNSHERSGKGRLVLTAVGCILFALLFFFAGWFARWFALGERAQSLLWAIETAQKHFYKDVDEGKLYEEFFSAFGLDPYSEYYTKEEYDAVLRANAGNGADTGIALSPYETNGKIRIFRVAGNSPAERAGLLGGMYLHRFGAEGVEMREGTRAELVAFVKEHPSFTVEAGFERDGSDAQTYRVTSSEYYVAACLYRDSGTAVRFLRDEKEPYHVRIGALENLPADTAYIRIDEFYGTAVQEFASCLAFMRERGRVNLVIDLRCNGGGYLSVFQGIAAYLMKDASGNSPIAATARYKGGKEEVFRAPSNNYSKYFTAESQVYILADENTASASECLIGALVSYGTVPYSHIFLRGQEDGTAKTYGKGIMQSHYTDVHGNVLKLTSAEIFWPSGKSIHGVGVTVSDGAVALPAPMLPSAEDVFLTQLAERLAA